MTNYEHGKLDEIVDKLDQVLAWLNGDGSKENPGAKVRLDRLEQKEEARAQAKNLKDLWLIAMVGTGGLTSIAGLIIQLYRH